MSHDESVPPAPRPSPGAIASDPFRAVFDAHPAPMWILDCESARLLAVNAAAALRHGSACGEMEGVLLQTLAPPDDAGRSAPIIDDLRNDPQERKPTVRTLRQLRKDGSAVETEVSSWPTPPFDGRRARLCLLRDGAEKRRASMGGSRYQALLDNSRDKVIFFAADGRILECNRIAERGYGYTREELLRLRLADLVDPSTVQDASEKLSRTTEDGLRFETLHRRRDGSTFPADVSLRAASVGDERVVVSVVRDLTDVSRTRAVLQSVEQRLRFMLEDAPLAVVVLDRHGTVDYANPFFLTLTGRSWTEVVGKRAFGAFLSPGGDAAARAHFQNELVTAAGVRQVSWTQSVLRDAAGAAEGFLYIGSDMTEHWHSERALRKSERRFRALIEGHPDGVAVCTDGKLTYVNPALAWIIGRTQSDVLGKPMEDLLHEGDKALFRSRIAPDRPTREPGESLPELRFLRAGGKIAYLELASLPVDADGGAAVLRGARDVTERRQMQKRLVQASRLASVGTLAAGVAHEINNPLAYVEVNLGYVKSVWPSAAAELVARRDGTPLPEGGPPITAAVLADVGSALEEGTVGVERVRGIVAGLKEFARSEAESLRRLDLREVVESSLALIAHELRHRARVITELASVPEVLGNDSRLTQVFINLLLNAAQSLPPEEAAVTGNEVRVRTSVNAAGAAVVSIEDTGCGIAPENVSRIFDPFFTTRAVGEGAGLGLSIAHGIVSSLGGEIEVESTVGKGTTVRVVLPSADEEEGAAARGAE
ncbi:MAG: hypothetical protein NVSMB23_20440 [Myxococcales bacterium]